LVLGYFAVTLHSFAYLRFAGCLEQRIAQMSAGKFLQHIPIQNSPLPAFSPGGEARAQKENQRKLEHFAIENIHSFQTIPAHLKALLNQKHP
jgi:hypothetical protein